jgi:hypothetical protein
MTIACGAVGDLRSHECNDLSGNYPFWSIVWKNVSASAAASKIPIRASSLFQSLRGGGKKRRNAGICFAIAAAMVSLLA